MEDNTRDCPDDCWSVHANLNLDSTTCECPCHREGRKCFWWCASLHKPHKGPCFEMYSHEDTCPGKPDCVHSDSLTPLDALDAMCYALDRIFADSQTRANKSKEISADEAHEEFFKTEEESWKTKI